MIATINGVRNTDYHMDFTHKEIEPAEPKTVTVDIPSSDGVVDLTNALSRRPYFGSRKIRMDFEIRTLRGEWANTMADLNHWINGQVVTVEFSDDPGWYWEGRASVGKLKDNGYTAAVQIVVDAYPYKWRNGMIDDYSDNVSGNLLTSVQILDMIGDPEFIVSANMTVSDGTETWTVTPSNPKAYGFRFYEGYNRITVTGSGTLKIRHRGGTL